MENRGAAAYFGEPVSQLDHGLQAAALAVADGQPDSLVAACLLHDIGHALSGHDEDCAERGIDDHHEGLGARWLAARFGPEVREPVRLHVAAKRYRCAVDASYAAGLSPASVQSLRLQGGPMSTAERTAFESEPYGDAALKLRAYDERAKDPTARVPALDHYRPLLLRLARPRDEFPEELQ